MVRDDSTLERPLEVTDFVAVSKCFNELRLAISDDLLSSTRAHRKAIFTHRRPCGTFFQATKFEYSNRQWQRVGAGPGPYLLNT
jgi:hypothetical protein